MRKEVLSKVFAAYSLWFMAYGIAYADTLNRAEALYLQGSYSESIEECAAAISHNKDIDKAYYLLGLNYLKINDTEKAREKLKILLDNYMASRYFDSAKLAYADTFFVEQDFTVAKELYEAMVKGNSKVVSSAYLGLARCALKIGDWQGAQGYWQALQQKFPQSLDAKLARELFARENFFFTVQVGSFASIKNAERLVQKLMSKNFDAYIDELNSDKSLLHRVRVGKVKTREEALALKNRLDQEGYPTRIFP